MPRFVTLLWILLALVPALDAQDTAAAGAAADSSVRQEVARRRLQQAIERRFAQVVRRQLGLSDDQMARLKVTEERFRPRRQALARRQALLRTALQAQMRPGQAADADSVRALLEGIQENREGLLQVDEQQDHEMLEYLTPVQLAQLKVLRERLMHRLQEVRRQRMMRGRDRPGSDRDRPRRP